MSDAHQFSLHLILPALNRNAEAVAQELYQFASIETLRNQDSCDSGRRVVRREQLQTERQRSFTRRFRHQCVTRIDIWQTFGVDHFERLVKAENQRDGGGPRSGVLVALRLQLFLQIEIETRRLDRLGELERACGHRDHAQPGRQHQCFLTARDKRVDAPFVHLLFEDADRCDSIDDKHRTAATGNLADRGNRMHRAGGSLAGLHEHRARLWIRLERIVDLFGTRRTTPFDAHLVAGDSECVEQLAPSLAELAAVDEDRVLARLQEIDDGRFHRASAGRRKQYHLARSTVERFHPIARRVERGAELRRAMVDYRTRHLEQNLGRHRRRPGREQIFFYLRHFNLQRAQRIRDTRKRNTENTKKKAGTRACG